MLLQQRYRHHAGIHIYQPEQFLPSLPDVSSGQSWQSIHPDPVPDNLLLNICIPHLPVFLFPWQVELHITHLHPDSG